MCAQDRDCDRPVDRQLLWPRRHAMNGRQPGMTRILLANLALGIFTIAVGGMFVAKGLDAVGVACDVIGVLLMHATVRRHSAR